jgi:hypothetical protein
LSGLERSSDLEGLLTDYQRRRFGTEIVRAVKRGQEASPVSRPRPVRPKQAYINRANALGQWRKQLGKKLHMESDIILPKGWMQVIAEQDPRSLEELAALMPDSPWRLTNFGEQILKAIR